MKRFFGILICVFALAGCDDGDLVVDSVDFSEVTTSSCPNSNLLFKLKEGEALILNIPAETFVNNPTDTDDPIKLDVNATNEVVYNFYNGTVASGNICDLIPPATPSINKQWYASSGVIEITTVAVKKILDESNNSTRITGYKNSIVFKDITFKKEDGTTQFYETMPFGDYTKSVSEPPMAFQKLLKVCSNTKQIYDFSQSESFTLDNIDSALIVNEVTPINTPRIGTIGPIKNKLAYRSFTNGVLKEEYFCQTTVPPLPTVSEEWFGREGGIIEVTTTTSGPNTFKHTIVFKNVTLEKDNSNFQLGTSYLYGEFETIKQ
jgi:hypothetical protein